MDCVLVKSQTLTGDELLIIIIIIIIIVINLVYNNCDGQYSYVTSCTIFHNVIGHHYMDSITYSVVKQK